MIVVNNAIVLIAAVNQLRRAGVPKAEAVLRAGFNAVGAPPYVNGIAMGAILLIVAVLDGPYLARRLHWLVRRRAH